MNIFSSIWKKHYKKGASAIKLADDVGAMKGIIGVQPYNPITGELGIQKKYNNLLVNQSKSNIIRLISQGQSPWIGQVNPADLKISRMRFGNAANHGTPNKLYYYDFNELSSRNAIPAFQDGESSARFAGGLSTQSEVLGEPKYLDAHPDAASIGKFEYGLNNMKKYSIAERQDLITSTLSAQPPSHGTLVVKLYLTTGLTPTVPVETIYFENDVYTKTRSGILPTKIVSQNTAESSRISTPAGRPNDNTSVVPATSGDTASGTRLIYDYISGSRGWKFLLDENGASNPNFVSKFNSITFEFLIGENNIINSIVPQIGWNANFTDTSYAERKNKIPLRFQGNQDYYNILSTEYRDSENDYIDDFSVTFGINMPGHLGNGNTDSNANQYIKYKEAFLSNGRDELFSSVWLPNSFDKNSAAAYFISWTILAPIN